MLDQPTKTRRRSGFEAKRIADLFKYPLIPLLPGTFPARRPKGAASPKIDQSHIRTRKAIQSARTAKPGTSKASPVQNSFGSRITGRSPGAWMRRERSRSRSYAVHAAKSGILGIFRILTRVAHSRCDLEHNSPEGARKLEALVSAAVGVRRCPRPVNFIFPGLEKIRPADSMA